MAAARLRCGKITTGSAAVFGEVKKDLPSGPCEKGLKMFKAVSLQSTTGFPDTNKSIQIQISHITKC